MKRLLILIGLAAIAVAIAFPSFATEQKTEIIRDVKAGLNLPEQQENPVILQIGSETVTQKEFQTFKEYLIANQKLTKSSATVTDEYVLKEYICDLLLYEKAEESGVVVDFAEAQQYAKEMRALIEKSDDETKRIQDKVIDATGLDTETYWNTYAPKMYQQQLSIEKLITQLSEQGMLATGSDPNTLKKAYEAYREELYRAAKPTIQILQTDLEIAS
ncbi:hypothetical protein [Brevibacillus dissolubilis]|uniref:hypothetical protein n=1 Tax=Brevibacillus dissolubilis TaxID=1844116 RepID=UPI00111716F0|nr:hypothetical protein [Brevibacillus dissolubilis]